MARNPQVDRAGEGLTQANRHIRDILRPIQTIKNYLREGQHVPRLDQFFLSCIMAPVSTMLSIINIDNKRLAQGATGQPLGPRLQDRRYPLSPDSRIDLTSEVMRQCTMYPELHRHVQFDGSASIGSEWEPRISCTTPAAAIFSEWFCRMLQTDTIDLALMIRLRLQLVLHHTDFENRVPSARLGFIRVLKDYIRGFPGRFSAQVPDDSEVLRYFPYRLWDDLGRTSKPEDTWLMGSYRFLHELISYALGRLQYVGDYIASHVINQSRSSAIAYINLTNAVWTQVLHLVCQPQHPEVTARYNEWRSQASEYNSTAYNSTGVNTLFDELFSMDQMAYNAYRDRCTSNRGVDYGGNYFESLVSFILWDLNDGTTALMLIALAMRYSLLHPSLGEFHVSLTEVISSLRSMRDGAMSPGTGTCFSSLKDPSDKHDKDWRGYIAVLGRLVEMGILRTEISPW
ncbi:hypothetical protein FOZ60_014901 [Perkinsus olseni]|nr:hypothetical protein FOZ60_014901 [Perkinsus olseni]KAF4713468.1 hypothetical protein FOZ62_008076 [Perkinsus olseni]